MENMKKGYRQGDMTPVVKDCQKPEGSYAESFDQSPLNYIDRQDKIQKSEASELKGQKHKGRY